MYPPLIIFALVISCLSGCDDAPSRGDDDARGLSAEDRWWTEDSFQDHTVPNIESVAQYSELAVNTREMRVVKFWVTEPAPHDPSQTREGWSERAMSRFYDGSFYTFHDEVYWYRLLRGHRVWGYDTAPYALPLESDNISDTYAEVRSIEAEGRAIPLDLRWTAEGRLYSQHFYRRALAETRRLILGSVLKIEARAGRGEPDAMWAFELEYRDEPTPTEIRTLRDVLRERLPPEASQLRWLTRSPAQEALAEELAAEGALVGITALTYQDLVVPGEAEVYSEGVSAGRARLIDPDASSNTSPRSEREILIYTRLPDELPPCRGIITAIPQTPLAHINLLARNRGIPNLYLSGVETHPALMQLAAARAPILLWTRAPNHWSIVPLSEDEYRAYLQLRADPVREVTLPETETPDLISLATLSADDALELRPHIGGKSAGLAMIHHTLGAGDAPVEPPAPLWGITGALYAEHLRPISAALDELLTDETFLSDALARVLALEGWVGIRARHMIALEMDPTRRDQLSAWSARLSAASQELIARGGVRGELKTRLLSLEATATLTETLRQAFETLHPQQGLRFRSSSNVEDLEGFNGAGLYSSATGFLYPRAQQSSADQARDLTSALRETWASYWSVEAFEERSSEGIDHRQGWMGVAVHPRFDDDLELNNGVMTLTLLPPSPAARGHVAHGEASALGEGMLARGQLRNLSQGRGSLIASATLNSQVGSLSVTNPDAPETLSEVIELSLFAPPELSEALSQTSAREPLDALAGEALQRGSLDLTGFAIDEVGVGEIQVELTRAQRSSLAAEVLSDDEAVALARSALRVTLVWWRAELSRHATARRPETLTLDFEYRGVDVGWPRLRNGPARSARQILKQARPLEPSPRGLPSGLREENIPLDILRRASEITTWRCESESLTVEALQVYTAPLASPSLGFSSHPFTAHIRFIDHRADAWRVDTPYTLHHRQLMTLVSSDQEDERSGAWALEVQRRSEVSLPFELISLSQTRDELRWIPRGRDESVYPDIIESASCASEVLYSSPTRYLEGVLERARVNEIGYGAHLD